MKKVRLLMASLLVIVAIGSFASSAHATSWYTCTITMAGPGWNKVYVRLTDAQNGDFTNQWFTAYPGSRDEILATALTAIANNSKVMVGLDSDRPYAYIRSIYIMSQ